MSQGSMHEQPLSVRTNGTGCGSIPFSRSSCSTQTDAHPMSATPQETPHVSNSTSRDCSDPLG
eukprot:1208238-Rhodomonas_salina.1